MNSHTITVNRTNGPEEVRATSYFHDDVAHTIVFDLGGGKTHVVPEADVTSIDLNVTPDRIDLFVDASGRRAAAVRPDTE